VIKNRKRGDCAGDIALNIGSFIFPMHGLEVKRGMRLMKDEQAA
jgi:hypothetical protein